MRWHDRIYSLLFALNGDDGRECLKDVYSPAAGGILMEGPLWPGVWNHNAFVGTIGWLPFMNDEQRVWVRNSLDLWFRDQRDDGLFPEYSKPDGTHKYYNDGQTEGDVFVDGHWMALGLIGQYILFSGDRSWTQKRLAAIRHAVSWGLGRLDKTGLFLVHRGGVVFEQCYGYSGYPSSTAVFAIHALRMLSEVECWLGNDEQSENYLKQAQNIDEKLIAVLWREKDGEGYLVSAKDVDGQYHGDGNYFESYPNISAGPLGVLDRSKVRKILTTLRRWPEIDDPIPMCVNYPARDPAEIHVNHNGPGCHMNGGAWMGLGGLEAWSYFMAGEAEKAGGIIDRLLCQREHHQLQDRVEHFGKDVEGKSSTAGRDHPARHSIGGFGNALRGMFNMQINAHEFTIEPCLNSEEIPEPITLRCYVRSQTLDLELQRNKDKWHMKINHHSLLPSSEGVFSWKIS